MKTLWLAVCFAASTALANSACAVEPAEHTVDWYQSHKEDRERVLGACQNDHSKDGSGDCMNALSASHGALADSFLQQSKEVGEPEADPAYYGHDAGMIAMTLSMCSRHNGVPESWCQAAAVAKSRLKH